MSSHLLHTPDLLARAQRVKVVFLDVDGVLTDGGLLYSEKALPQRGKQRPHWV